MYKVISSFICLLFVASVGCPGESPEYALVNVIKQYYSAQHASRFRQSYALLDSQYKLYVSEDKWVEEQKQAFLVFLPKPQEIEFKSFYIKSNTAKVEIAFDGIDAVLARPRLTELLLQYADQGEDYMMHYGEQFIREHRDEYAKHILLTLDFVREDDGWKLVLLVPEQLAKEANGSVPLDPN